MSILYQTFGCSFKILAGIFSGMTHYVMHKAHKRQQEHNIYTQPEQSITEDETIILNTVNGQNPQSLYPLLHYHTPSKTL